jgi:hypothetical protein
MRFTLAATLAIGALIGLAACAPAPAPTPAASAPAAAPTTDSAALAAGLAAQGFVEDLMKPHAAGEKGVYFVNLRDGQEVTSPFRVVFGLYGLGVAPAGVDKPDTGHHHLLVDAEIAPDKMGEMVPKDEKHIHFGGGQTETVLTLPPGPHTLVLVVADKDHVPLKPAVMSPKITVTVK